MKKILQFILQKLASIMLWRHKPLIIGITGSVGKSSAKEAIYAVLKNHFKVRRSIKSYNNELGVPLTILGLKTGNKSLVKWTKNLFKSVLNILINTSYPEMLILEMGADRPGDINYLTDLAQPKIALVTAIGQFPVHLEFFPERDSLVEEKKSLIKNLDKKGTAILNYDDLSVRQMRDDVIDKTNIITYGFGEGADLQLSDFNQYFLDINKTGITFKVSYKGSTVPIRISKSLGRQQAYAAAAAAATGLVLGLNLIEISQALKRYKPLPGRTNLLSGIKHTLIIDDSYNASPTATLAALEILQQFQSRRIAVLADMLELGEYTEPGHRQVGDKAAEVVDYLIVVGNRARFIADQAKKSGLSKDRIFEFDQIEKAALKLQEILRKGDTVLVKGSQAMRTEKAVKEIMAYPEKANKLLVRQLWTN